MHGGDTEFVKDILFACVIFLVAKRVMLGNNIMRNDKVTASGLQKIKSPHYGSHFITMDNAFLFLFPSSSCHSSSCRLFFSFLFVEWLIFCSDHQSEVELYLNNCLVYRRFYNEPTYFPQYPQQVLC